MKAFILMLVAFVLILVLALPVFIFNSLRLLYRKEKIEKYFFSLAISLDQLGGTLLYQQEDWTVSSYTYYLCTKKNNSYACWFMKFIDTIFGENHCFESYETEKTEFKDQVKKHG